MMLAAVIFSHRELLAPVALALVGGLALIGWGYWNSPGSRPLRLACLALKLLGLAGVVGTLLEPVWTSVKARPGANFFAMVADNSQGMEIKDRNADKSRGAVLKTLLTEGAATWRSRMEENFQVRRYQFDHKLQAVPDFASLDFKGSASAIGASLQSIRDRFQGQPLAGVLMFTDGNATDLTGTLPDLSGLPPVYPVVMGSDDPIKDLSLQKVSVSQTAFEDAPVTVQADVLATGFNGETVQVEVLELTGRPEKSAGTNLVSSMLPKTPKVVAQQTMRPTKEEDTLTFRFQVKPEKSGLSFFMLRTASKMDAAASTNQVRSEEATLVNNRQVIAVDRGKGPYRILYVAGRPNWEYKFLSRALASDETQVELVGLIRIARREPKFEFRGRSGEISNPLFRGFDRKTEETERYDQAVMTRLNTRDEHELKGGFPKTAEELYGYHGVIIDDLEAEFFTREQMVLLQKFVSERGGGVFMFGGQESFVEGGYARTPLGDILPVYLDRQGPDRPGKGLKYALTREGWLQPWVRLRTTEEEEKHRIQEMPPFQVLNVVRDVKPGASVLATVKDDAGHTFTALAGQRLGHGRTGALMIGDFWRWGFKDDASHKDLDKAWRQMMRWLVSDVPNRIEFRSETAASDSGSVTFLVRAKEKNFEAMENATVSISVEAVAPLGETSATAGAVIPKAATVKLTAEPVSSEPGLYQATFVPREPGGYRAVAVVQDGQGLEVGQEEAGWSSDPAGAEFRSLKPNRALMESIARKTGGQVIEMGKLEAFAAKLPNLKAPLSETVTTPLWHTSWWLLFSVACITAEWGLRRKKGLA